MIRCAECGASISDTAKACPQCGAKVPRKAVWPWVVAGIIGGFVALVLIGNASYDPEKDRMQTRYELCMKDLNDPLAGDRNSKMTIVRPTCDRFRDEFRAKYGYNP